MMREKRPRKICLASSVGGHLQELLQLMPVYGAHPHFYVLNDRTMVPDFMQGKTYFITHSERDFLFLWNLWEALRIFWRERPTHFISTGAGLAVPLALVARILAVKVMYIETFAAIYRPTLTGRLLYWIADRFVYQWPNLSTYYPRAVYAGTIFNFRLGR